ncbi:hypothetical protein M422DRAFT_264588 [Sphaerobolus stellatus SS14]|uniref:Uncharacterized protein n=1 Tax=Sphaerobolus stellatus (strain SS14) TaxID=990650 RepID=A0A0C9UW53_SPHS4|nr:hypothetical protein M422DRAFT_264588 [Sphaerobolus stellatus SS14]
MPPHCEHSPARQERNKKLLIAYIAFNMTQDDKEEEDPVLLALMVWATRGRVAIGDQIGEEEDSPGLVWKRQVTFQASTIKTEPIKNIGFKYALICGSLSQARVQVWNADLIKKVVCRVMFG